MIDSFQPGFQPGFQGVALPVANAADGGFYRPSDADIRRLREKHERDARAVAKAMDLVEQAAHVGERRDEDLLLGLDGSDEFLLLVAA